jgi:hypothetical protein
MKWPTIEQMREFTALPPGYVWDLLQPDEIEVAIAFFSTWFPAISVGMGSPLLDTRFYEENVVVHGSTDRSVMAVTVRQHGEIVALATWEKVDGADVLYGRVGAVAKPHRQSNLAIAGQQLAEKMGKHMGAGLIYGMATMSSPYMQRALEHAGYTAVGIMPGFDREEGSDGVINRVYEVMYAKQLADAAEYLLPLAHNMTPGVARLYAAIFPEDGEAPLSDQADV